MLKNMTIRARVIGAFALVLAATIGLGLFATERLTAVNRKLDDVGNNWLPSANVLGDLSQDFEQLRARQGQFMLAPETQRPEQLAKIAESEKKVAADLKAYEPLISEGKEAELAKAIQDKVGGYLSTDSALQEKVAGGDMAGAITFYFGDMQDDAFDARDAIRGDRAYQLKAGDDSAEGGIRLGKSAVMLILVALGITAAICATAGFLMIRSISAPIKHMAGVMEKLAAGDTSVVIPNAGERNEIGAMARTVEIFRDNLIRTQALEDETRIARQSAEEQRKQTMHALADKFESAVGGIVNMVSSAATEMQATASQLTASAQESSAQAGSVSAAAEEAGTNVTSVAGSAEELGASVSEIGRQVEHSLNKAREAVTEADATAAIVYELSQAADRINGIVELISGIAAQTNLLALNATIESARAGEAGRGFAVVASEVKALAQQTAKATADIGSQISSIQNTTKRAVGAIESITGTIREINDSSATIAAAVDQQGAATSEIVQAVNQASVGTQEVTSNISGVARMAEETGMGAAQVLSASGELAQQAEMLRSQVQSFIADIRAA